MNFEFMTIDTPLPPCMAFPRALTGFPVSSTAKVMYCRMLDAMLFRFWVFPDCTFLDISKITVIEPPKISRSISDRVDYPPIRLSCFGIISVSFRCQFASSPRCRSSPESHNGVSLPLVCSFRSGFLHIPAKSHGTTSPGKHIPHRLVIRLE